MHPKLKLILTLAVFVTSLCLIADFVFSKWFTKTQSVAESNKIYRLAYESHPNEIPIFGSSRVEKGYYCDAINSNCYNYGFPNQSFDVTALLLKLELEEPKNTPLIIDVHHDFFKHDAFANINLNTYLPFVSKNKNITGFLESNNRLKPYHYMPGTRYFGAYTAYIEPIAEHKLGLGRAHYIKGGVYDTKAGNTLSISKRIDSRLEKDLHFDVIAEKNNQLEQLIKSHPNRKFVFVVSPYHWSAKSTVNNFDEMINYFSAFEQQFSNVAFIYFSTDEYPDTLFKDTVHLNEAGAKKFSAELKKQLAAKGII
jgi:flavodoxin